MSDIVGKASRMILGAIVNGETDPVKLAGFALGRVHASEHQLVAALTGHVDDHHRFLLREHLTQIAHLEQAIERVTKEIARRFTPPLSPDYKDSRDSGAEQAKSSTQTTAPEQSSSPKAALNWEEAMILLCSIPGVSERAAYAILDEIGIKMH